MVDEGWDTSAARRFVCPNNKTLTHAMCQSKMPAWQTFTVICKPVDAKLVESDDPSTISSSGEVGSRLKLDDETKSNYGCRLHNNRLRMSQGLRLQKSSLDSVRSDFRTVKPNIIQLLDMNGPIYGEANVKYDAVSQNYNRWSNELHERCQFLDKYAQRIFERFFFKLVSLINRSAFSPTSPFSGQFLPFIPI